MATAPLPLDSGQYLGRYELLAPVAKGGMGQVWVGRLRGARGFQKLVAIKTVLPATGDDERLDRMLFEEARIASLIQHSNVVQTLELGEHQGALYLVMEWVDGEPLSYLIKHCAPAGGMPLFVAVNLIAQTLRGLHAAHELTDDNGVPLGVVHRDVSPHNVLVSYSGVAKLVDFGIAKAMNQDSSSTTTGEIKGKFAYMAPEQILERAVDRRADVFAIGIMLYLLTTGRHPFKGQDSAGVLHSITSDEPAPLPSLVMPGYSPALESVVMKAIAKDPAQRWATADEMRIALQRAVPDAFGIGFEAQLGKFLLSNLGERATTKRDALRRAELASEARRQDSGALSIAAQSVSSLRAVAVDNGAGPSERSILPTLHPAQNEPPPLPAKSLSLNLNLNLGLGLGKTKSKSRRRGLAAAGLSAAVLLVFGLLHASGSERSSANGSGATMVELTTGTGSRKPRAPLTPAEPTPAEPTPALAASIAIVPLESSAKAASALPKRSTAKTSKPHGPVRAPSSDLIAPDYAR